MTRPENALAVREAIETAHPEIGITTPLTARSGKWELSIDNGTTTIYDDFWLMVDFLAARYDSDAPGDTEH